MAVYINTLSGGDITVGSAPAPTPTTRTATRVWYGDDENVYTDIEIEGAINADSYDEVIGYICTS